MTNNAAGVSSALKQNMSGAQCAAQATASRRESGGHVGTVQDGRRTPSLNSVRPISPPILSEAYMPRPFPQPMRQAVKRPSQSDAEAGSPKMRVVSTATTASLQPGRQPQRQRPLLGIQRTGPDGQVYIEIIRPLNENDVPEGSIEDAYFVTEEGADTDSRESSEAVPNERAVTSIDQNQNLTQHRPEEAGPPKCSLFCFLFRIICRCSGNYSFTYGEIVDKFLAHANISNYPPRVIEKVKKSLLQTLLTNECFEFAGMEDKEDEEGQDGFDFSSHVRFSWKLASNLNLSVISTALANDSSHECPTADSLLGITSEEEEEGDPPVFLDDLLRSD